MPIVKHLHKYRFGIVSSRHQEILQKRIQEKYKQKNAKKKENRKNVPYDYEKFITVLKQKCNKNLLSTIVISQNFISNKNENLLGNIDILNTVFSLQFANSIDCHRFEWKKFIGIISDSLKNNSPKSYDINICYELLFKNFKLLTNENEMNNLQEINMWVLISELICRIFLVKLTDKKNYIYVATLEQIKRTIISLKNSYTEIDTFLYKSIQDSLILVEFCHSIEDQKNYLELERKLLDIYQNIRNNCNINFDMNNKRESFLILILTYKMTYKSENFLLFKKLSVNFFEWSNHLQMLYIELLLNAILNTNLDQVQILAFCENCIPNKDSPNSRNSKTTRNSINTQHNESDRNHNWINGYSLMDFILNKSVRYKMNKKLKMFTSYIFIKLREKCNKTSCFKIYQYIINMFDFYSSDQIKKMKKINYYNHDVYGEQFYNIVKNIYVPVEKKIKTKIKCKGNVVKTKTKSNEKVYKFTTINDKINISNYLQRVKDESKYTTCNPITCNAVLVDLLKQDWNDFVHDMLMDEIREQIKLSKNKEKC
ncbi:hypothetical protein A3Q56_02557 [Intoshia linei]|uniref:Uncharacterized protein n=1 Tax=Intoshia linei TaxID=1819745 RepID=A0A177B6B9_9BILA|nr:hypothetical protein A3Q56_02557 [Intoshia linei]